MIKRPSFSWTHLALFVGIVHFVLITALGLSRHWGYLSSIYDLGVFDQAVWGIVNGAPFINTSNPLGVPINWLGFHFNPILLVFVPFYHIYPAAEWLILFQATAISITAWPLFLIARRVTQSDCAAFLWATIYLINPFVLSAAAWDFHPVSLAAPFMALGVLAIEMRQHWLFGLACFFLLLIQEHFGIAVAGFGVLWWLRNRSLVPAVSALCIGMAHVGLVLGVIMPAFSPTGGHVMLSHGLGHLSRYAWLGDSLGEIVQTVLNHPISTARYVLVDLRGAKYLAFLLLPLLATPLVGVELLLPGLADLLANLLSSINMPRGLFAYHSISLIPILVIAAIYGSTRIASKWRTFSFLGLTNLILWASLLLGYLAAPLPLPLAANYWRPAKWSSMPERAVSDIRKLIPREVAVSAQANVAAHFSQRYRIYPFPAQVGKVEFIVLRLESPTMKINGHPGQIATLEHHLAMPPRQYLNAVEQLLANDRYGVGWWAPPWLVFSKGNMTPAETEHAVRRHLAGLKREWALTDGHAPQASPSVANP